MLSIPKRHREPLRRVRRESFPSIVICWLIILLLTFCYRSNSTDDQDFPSDLVVQRDHISTNPSSKVDFTIVVLTKSRYDCLSRLLDSIQKTDYQGDAVLLQIKVDMSEAQDQRDVIKLAKSFKFKHGSTEYTISETPLGLAKSWFRAWKPYSDDDNAIILEDDIVLSPEWYRWLKGAWSKYSGREDLAGISLQRQTLVPLQPHHSDLKIRSHRPFLYNLVGSIGFSPNPRHWKQFLHWVELINLDEFDVSTPGLVTSEWWNILDKRHMWTQHFIYFSVILDLRTLYVHLPLEETLAAHTRAKGAHFEKDEGADFQVAESVALNFPGDIDTYDWDGELVNSSALPASKSIVESTMMHTASRIQAENGFVYLLFLNAGYLDMTKSWICNILQVAESVLNNTIFISSDIRTTRKLFAFKSDILIFTQSSELTDAVSFGSFKYYSVVLERLKLQNEFLQRGISIQIIESDQFWSEDISSLLRAHFQIHEIIAGQEGPFPQTLQTVSRICGGFHGVASTNRSRIFFEDYLLKYSATLDARERERNSSQLTDHEDDQAALTRLALESGLHIQYLDRCVYANGLWFEVENFSEHCPLPSVIHNGYIRGNAAKVSRAKRKGYWFVSHEGEQCL